MTSVDGRTWRGGIWSAPAPQGCRGCSAPLLGQEGCRVPGLAPQQISRLNTLQDPLKTSALSSNPLLSLFLNRSLQSSF